MLVLMVKKDVMGASSILSTYSSFLIYLRGMSGQSHPHVNLMPPTKKTRSHLSSCHHEASRDPRMRKPASSVSVTSRRRNLVHDEEFPD